MPATDLFQDQYLDPQRAGLPHWPAKRVEVVTPDDSNDLAYVSRWIYVGAGGDLVVIVNAVEVTFGSVQPGTLLPIRVSRVKTTGTTATQILALC